MAPVVQLGFQPVLVDCNMKDLGFALGRLRVAIEEYKPQAVLNVTPMGLVPDLEELELICEEYGVLLIEDNCDSFGSGGVGDYGLASTWSFYWGHHISTIEGGMVTTNDFDLANTLRSVRSHGWSREFSKSHQEVKSIAYDLNENYTFYHCGFNLRNTEINAFLGLLQLERCGGMTQKRRALEKRYKENINCEMWMPITFGDNCLMGWPIIASDEWQRLGIHKRMEKIQVESRPLLAGNIARHPAYRSVFAGISCPNADQVRKCGMYLPLHPGMFVEDVDKICEVVLCNHET